MELAWLYLIPLLTAAMCACPIPLAWLGRVQILGNLSLLIIVWQWVHIIQQAGPQLLWHRAIYLDALSGLMLLLIALIGLPGAVYAMRYMLDEEEEKLENPWKLRAYYLLFNLFLLTLLVMVTVNNLGAYWIAIEGSTIFSAFLVGYYNRKESVEAAWKYIILCTVGIAFALIGLILTYSAVQKAGGSIEQGLDWTYLQTIAGMLDHNLIKASFVFILIGFGTKAGIAPLHSWLPDAHSEAPSPVSALLSGVLLKCALFGLIRYGVLANGVLGAGFIQPFFLFFGLLSLLVSVPFILLQKNVKRLLAYSSIEHIGIILTGLGFGSPIAVFGALFHIFNHALAKTLMFFAAGNLSLKYRSKQISHITGALHLMPLTGSFLLLGGLALAGMPPFSLFLSEFYIVLGGIQGQHWMESALFILLVLMIFGGFTHHLLRMTIGPEPLAEGTFGPIASGEPNRSSGVAMVLPFLLILVLAWWLPEPLLFMLHEAVKIIAGGSIS